MEQEEKEICEYLNQSIHAGVRYFVIAFSMDGFKVTLEPVIIFSV